MLTSILHNNTDMNGLRKIVLIPTYNEKENIRIIIGRLMGMYRDIEIWVIDDNSPDGTKDQVKELQKEHPSLRLIVRDKKDGLGEAYKHALRILQKMPDVGSIVTMDADGSHDPERIAHLLKELETHDLAIGSRYTRGGGGMSDAGFYRDFLSRGGNLYARLIIGHGIKDSTAGFVAYRKSAIDGVDIDSISSAGYSYQIEFKNKLLDHGRTWIEVPISFPDRTIGVSKMSGNIIKEGIISPWKIAYRQFFLPGKRRRVVTVSLVAAAFLFAGFFSAYKLIESPPVWYDEGIYIQISGNAAYGLGASLRTSPGELVKVSEITVGYPHIWPLAAVQKIFGHGVAQVRSYMAIVIIIFLIVAYALSRRLYGPRVSAWTLGLLVTFAPLYGNGKSALGEVPGLLYLALSLWLLDKVRTVEKPRSLVIFASGLLAGIAVATKPYFILYPLALVVALFIKRKTSPFTIKDILIGAAGALLPLIVWVALQFNPGDSISSVMARYANPYQYGDVMSVITGNIKGLFMGIGPLYLLALIALWIISMWIRRRRSVQIDLAEVAAYTFVIISMLAFLRTSGMYRYIFPAQIVSILFLAPSLHTVTKERVAAIIMIVPIAFGAYQVGFNSWVADSYASNKTTLWQNYFDGMPPTKSVFFYDSPEVALFKKDGNYFQYLEPGPGLKVGSDSMVALKNKVPDEVIVVTDRLPNIDRSLLVGYPRAQSLHKYSILRKK